MKERTINEQRNVLQNVFKMKPVVFICISSSETYSSSKSLAQNHQAHSLGNSNNFLFNERKLIHLSCPHFGMSLYAWMKMKI